MLPKAAMKSWMGSKMVKHKMTVDSWPATPLAMFPVSHLVTRRMSERECICIYLIFVCD